MDNKNFNLESNPYHNMVVKERKYLEISGIKKIDHFDEEEFLLESVQGNIEIKGIGLTLDKLDKERGDVIIKGRIESIQYTNQMKNSKESIFTKLFK